MPATVRRFRLQDAVPYGVALALLVALGLLNLYMPFVDDQASVMLGAKVLDQGGTLYVDWWSNKMPALFWFYQFAGSLFGWTEQGLHFFELLYMLAFSAALMLTLRGWFRAPWLAALAPVAVVGTYYASALISDLTLVEMLVSFPLYLSLWCASRCRWESPSSAGFAFASGVFAGVTVTFKLIFAPLLVAVWAVTALHLIRARDPTPPGGRARLILRRGVAPVTAGVVLVVGGVVAFFWQREALPALLWTAFEYPPLALQSAPPAPLYRLLESVAYFVSFYCVWFGFILVAVAEWWRGDRDRLTSLLLVWLVMAIPILLVQRFSWWQYHVYFLYTPAGLLGVKGLSVAMGWIVEERPLRGWRAVSLCLLLGFPPVAALAIPARDKITPLVYTFVRHQGTRLDYQFTFRPVHRRIFESTRFLRDRQSMPGPIYVFGPPMYYHFARRDPAIAIPGVTWRYLVDRQWDELAAQLAAADAAYIYVDRSSGRELLGSRPRIWEFISRNYEALTSDDGGTWFRRIARPAGTTDTVPSDPARRSPSKS